ncbi:hypothetical protein [Sphingobacterium sp. T2]|uniref:hypothetical protein n=1 Tax=Sphingobacterium sp. T2 TaxID=1590596 RepID=UPI001E6324A1|nr:hypothetical protein [Sphingobacterium sp. T2]
MQDINLQLPHILDQIIASLPFLKAELALAVAFLGSIVATLFLDKHWKYCSFVVTVLGIVVSFLCVTSQYCMAVSARYLRYAHRR